jgi:hypothetical protein
MDLELVRLLKLAVECSVYVNPTDPGLSFDELVEVGSRFGRQAGEISDHINFAQFIYSKEHRYVLDRNSSTIWLFFVPQEDPDYRNIRAFDIVVSELNNFVKTNGARGAMLDRNVIVERAVAAGVNRHDAEVAITCMLLSGSLQEKDGQVHFPNFGLARPLPSAGLTIGAQGKIARPDRAQFYPVVRDVIARRADGRPRNAEPFDAFAEQLEALGYRTFRGWWSQIVAELKRGDVGASPVSVLVMAAAIVEGALTFAAKHSRDKGLDLFKSNNFDGEPKTWKLEQLVASATLGGDRGILNAQSKARAEALIQTRQRIHAGRMLSLYPGGPPDLRPEEARDAKATAEIVVRSVLDWLQVMRAG